MTILKKDASEEEIRNFELKQEVLQRLRGDNRQFDYICTDCEIILKSKEEAMEHLVKTWAELPEKYKEDIENWLNNQEGDWSGIEDTGWLTLRDNYLAHLIDKFITEIDEIKKEVLERMTDGQKGN
jgi:hypothetical protein